MRTMIEQAPFHRRVGMDDVSNHPKTPQLVTAEKDEEGAPAALP